MEAISKNPFVPALKPDQRTTSIGEAAHYSCKMGRPTIGCPCPNTNVSISVTLICPYRL